MTKARPPVGLLRRLVQAAYAVVALIGLKYGYDFGQQIAGPLMGVLLAINTAVFGVLIASALAGRLVPDKAVAPEQTEP